MRITEIRGFHLSFALPEPMGNALTLFKKRDALLVQVMTDEGICGWGESGNSPQTAGAFIRTRLAAMLLGQSPLLFGKHYQAMCASVGYDRRGAAMMGISAIDLALHDIAARVQGISVAAMLGGPVRDHVLAYASGPFFLSSPEPYRDFQNEVDRYLKLNFRAIKPRGGYSPRADGAMMKAMRKQTGDDVGLMVDFNQGYTARAAIESARQMEEAELLWIEEPVLPEDITGYRTVADAVPTAIAGGEALGSLIAYRDFVTAGAFSILQPDMAVCGGYSGFRNIWALGQAYDLPVMPHVFGTTVNFHASLQMASLIEARRGGGPEPYPFMEYDMMDNPLLSLCGTTQLDAQGRLAVPDGIGTGIELKPEMLEQWITSHWVEKV